jgi:hypothetical protein
MTALRVLAIFFILLFIASATVPNDRPAEAIPDVSWPNCQSQNLPRGNAGIVGITGGLSFHLNPCLAKEARFHDLSAYVNSGYPGLNRARSFRNLPKPCRPDDESCLAYNYGYNAVLYAREYAFENGIVPHRFWIDVEFGNTWSDDANINRHALQGMVDAAGSYVGAQNVGIYSYPFQWGVITNHWQNGSPAWVATGSSQKAAAVQACNQPSFTGGPVLMAQYTIAGQDQNIICR